MCGYRTVPSVPCVPYLQIVSTVDTEQANVHQQHVKPNLFVVLLRISTKKSGGADSHGVAAQKRDIELFLSSQHGAEVIAELTEVESGAAESRPVLEEALHLCRTNKATLLVQKVDRLSRDLEQLARIVKDKTVPIRVATLPNADNFQIHLFGALAAQEREFISIRTRAALASARERGVRLGNPNLAEINRGRSRTASAFACNHAPLIKSLRDKGKTLREICEVLNDAGIKTARGCEFHPVQITRILRRTAGAAA
jgi:DNA invertase Pin-like site-specific DNA recombinase